MQKQMMTGKEAVSPPAQDIMLIEQHGLQCSLAKKSGPGKPWETVQAEVSLQSIRSDLSLPNVWEIGVLVEGFIYWSSRTPDVFNSGVIEQGKLIISELSCFEIVWTAFLRVTSGQKAKKVLRQLGKMLGYHIAIATCEPYWKDKSLHRAQFTTTLATADVKEAVFMTLQICHNIGNSWSITPPTKYREQDWEFCGGTQRISVAGVTMIDFELHNFITEWSGKSYTEHGNNR